MASSSPINLYVASENDLKLLDGIGNAKAKRIIELRENNESLTFNEVAEATQIKLAQWTAWSDAGIVTIEKPQVEASANLPAPEPTETNQLHITLIEMNKSLQQLRDEVQTLRSELS